VVAGQPVHADQVAGVQSSLTSADHDRLQEMGWEPEDEDYTEKGNVKANDVILRRIAEKYPVAEILADLMAVNKLMGQLSDGKNSWLNMVDDDGFIRAYVNPCGAVTTRATHSYPKPRPDSRRSRRSGSHPSEITWEGDKAFIHDKKGNLIPVMAKAVDKPDADPEEKVTVKLLGLAGGWGIESRRLFCVPEGWSLVGSDLAGIELRCLAHRMAKYDGGAYGKVLLEGDIHSENQTRLPVLIQPRHGQDLHLRLPLRCR
jgi:DNA polymerase-1